MQSTTGGSPGGDAGSRRHHRELMRRTVLRLLFIYLAPFILLTVYFHFQSLHMIDENRRRNLQTIAEYQAHMLDLFIRERAVNLANLIDDPNLEIFPSRVRLESHLEDLKRNSEAFADIGVFDADGVQVGYAGPFPVLERRSYAHEKWFEDLKRGESEFVITDIYLGFRQRPHFTIAVTRERNGRFFAVRATLDPDRMYDYITSLEGAKRVFTSIVNQDGTYQVVTPNVGTLLAESGIIPPRTPDMGVESVKLASRRIEYGYYWLVEADWALITQNALPAANRYLLGGDYRIAAVALAVVVLIGSLTVIRARKRVLIEEERDEAKLQLGHAAKLASVGELAAGIAHEINNPLAIISEEAGLVKDLMDPRFGKQVSYADLTPHLDTIGQAVFRCRDITRKLLGFVRRAEFNLAKHQVPALMDEVVDDFFLRRMAVSNIEIDRQYEANLPEITTDGNQLKQVFLNIISNAADAIEKAGRVGIRIYRADQDLKVGISDTGKGMTQEQLDRIFMPFYTTKEVGKGTGLGLSVSYGIIKSLDGKIEVSSKAGRGSTFTISLPIQ